MNPLMVPLYVGVFFITLVGSFMTLMAGLFCLAINTEYDPKPFITPRWKEFGAGLVLSYLGILGLYIAFGWCM